MIQEDIKQEYYWQKRSLQENWKDRIWLYVEGLSKAIESVKSNYVYNNTEKQFHLERVFAYELYYQWKKLLNKRGENPEKLMLNAELSKFYHNKKCDKKYRFPDMVLHGNYDDKKRQFIICEIKSTKNPISTSTLQKDIDSLIDGMDKLEYHFSVFIYVGNKWENTAKRMRQLVPDGQAKRILFIGVDGKKNHYELL